MAVLKTTSPTLDPSAPIDVPRKTEPSSRTSTAGLLKSFSDPGGDMQWPRREQGDGAITLGRVHCRCPDPPEF
jgi:hypothetical protein